MQHVHFHHAKNNLNAWLLAGAEAYMHRKYGPRKRAIFGKLPREVVEIGPGTGANFRYYAPGTHLTAIEPNPAMHPRLRTSAARWGIDLTIRGLQGEHLDLPDNGLFYAGNTGCDGHATHFRRGRPVGPDERCLRYGQRKM